MRWFWIDQFLEFERGKRAVAIKNCALAEEQFDGYCPGFPVMPHSLIIEGMAQTAGLLIGEMSGFEHRVVLAKIGKAVFHSYGTPGDTLRYTAVVDDVKTDGATAKVTSHVGDTLQAEVEFMFAFLDERFPPGPLFEPVDFLALLRSMHMYDVGKTAEGEPIQVPEYYAQAEREAYAAYAPIPSPVRPRGGPAA
jgi:3-hydroxyacyl-[acyl-carrier-protein] dehydratase